MKRIVMLAVMTAAWLPALLDAQQIDTAAFRLHKFKQAIGWERDTILVADGKTNVSMHFLFTDRGTPVLLNAHWLADRPNAAPRFFSIRGSTSRLSTINDTVRIEGDHVSNPDSPSDAKGLERAMLRMGYPIAGYAPVLMQQLLLQYWMAHGKPATLRTYKNAHVAIVERGRDTVTIAGRPDVLRRFAINGLIWGGETVWLDEHDALIALVSIDAEFDHFEAVRDGYEASLGLFISRAAADGADALAALTRNATPSSTSRGGSAAAASGSFALVGGTLIDGTGAPAVHDAIVLVRNGKIVAAGPRASVRLPSDGYTIVDVKGKSILPGLWDMHAHYEQVEWGPIYLAAGVTTARDVGNEFDFITSVRDAIASGKGIGPRIVTAGIIDGTGMFALGAEQAGTPEQGVALVRKYHDAHFNQIKIYSSVKLPVLQAITAEAHRLGMTVTGHIPTGMTGFDGVNAGMDQINHAQYIVPMMKGPAVNGVRPPLDTSSAEAHKAMDFLVSHHTVVDPTLVIFEMAYHPASTPFESLEPGALKVAPELRAQLTNTGVPPAAVAAAKVNWNEYLLAVAAMHRAGVTIVAGTDQTVPGYSLHRELELYVQAGFTPMEAIQAATSVPARVMGLENEVGTVTAGKRADLIVVDGDPLADIANLRRLTLVVANGKRYLPGPLWSSVGFVP